MALKDPLGAFNRQNPFVIKGKSMYRQLMDKYEVMSKTFIIVSTIHLVLLAIITTGAIIAPVWIAGFPIGFVFLIIEELILYTLFKKCIHDQDHEKIDKMVSIELNQVIEVNIEYVYEVINTLYRMIGKVEYAIKTIWIITLIGFISTVGFIIADVCYLILG